MVKRRKDAKLRVMLIVAFVCFANIVVCFLLLRQDSRPFNRPCETQDFEVESSVAVSSFASGNSEVGNYVIAKNKSEDSDEGFGEDLRSIELSFEEALHIVPHGEDYAYIRELNYKCRNPPCIEKMFIEEARRLLEEEFANNGQDEIDPSKVTLEIDPNMPQIVRICNKGETPLLSISGAINCIGGVTFADGMLRSDGSRLLSFGKNISVDFNDLFLEPNCCINRNIRDSQIQGFADTHMDDYQEDCRVFSVGVSHYEFALY